MAKDKSALNGNTGTLLRVGAIIAAIALAWGSQSGKITAVGEKVQAHLTANEKQHDAHGNDIKVLDNAVDANVLEITKVKIRADAFEQAQDTLIEETEGLRNDIFELKFEQRESEDRIIKAIKENGQ